MTWVWDHGPDDPVNRYIMLKLADNANDEGYCFPSLPEISARTRYSESTVRRAIHDLERLGYLTMTPGSGRGYRSEYQLIKRVSECHPLQEERVSERKLSERKLSERKLSHRQKKGVRVKNPPDPLLGRTVIEPSINPTPTPTPPAAQGGAANITQLKPLTPRRQRIADALAVFEVKFVMRYCSWNDPNLAPVILEAIEQYRRREAISIADAAKLMVTNWKQYNAEARFLRFQYSPRNWINHGHWINPEAWPFDQDKSARVQRIH